MSEVLTRESIHFSGYVKKQQQQQRCIVCQDKDSTFIKITCITRGPQNLDRVKCNMLLRWDICKSTLKRRVQQSTVTAGERRCVRRNSTDFLAYWKTHQDSLLLFFSTLDLWVSEWVSEVFAGDRIRWGGSKMVTKLRPVIFNIYSKV